MTQDTLIEANFILEQIQQLDRVVKIDSQGDLHLNDCPRSEISNVVCHVLLDEFLHLAYKKRVELAQRFKEL